MSSLCYANFEKVPVEKWYKFGSVSVGVHTDKVDYIPGKSVYYDGYVMNNNTFPITEGRVRLQIFYHVNNTAEYMVDEFFVAENLYLKPGETKTFGGFWDVPITAKSGEYQFEVYYVIDQFNMAGVSFLRGFAGDITKFNVVSGSDLLYLDTQNITVNGRNIDLHLYQPDIGPNDSISVLVPLVNEGFETASKISYKLYKWDDTRKDFLVSEQDNYMVVPENSRTMLNFVSEPLDSSAYLLKIEAEGGKNNNILKLRLPVRGKKVKTNFLGIDKFPIKRGDTINVFTALSSSADYFTNITAEIKLSIQDEGGNIVFNDSISGEEISWQIVGYETTFKADKKYNKLTLISEITDDAGNVDFVDLVYEAEDEPKGIGTLMVIIIIIILITLIAYIYLKKKTPLKNAKKK